MSVSVIVPSRGKSTGLKASVTSILAALDLLDNEQAELIVVLNGPMAKTATLDVRHPRLRVLTELRPGAAHARNIGMNLASNATVLFTDDDCIVPAKWCRDHLSALQESPATAAPVHVPHQGPITRYLDYKRIFAAPPLSNHTCRYFVTANCGINRSLIRWKPQFDDSQFNNAAEDAALGYEIIQRGGIIQWLGDAPPVAHALHEDPDELLERTFRYGVGNAKIVNAHHRWQESSPYADDWLISNLKEAWLDYRRFPEIVSSEERRLFIAFNILEASAWLIGYLNQTQRELAVEVFLIDHRQLELDLRRFIQSLLAATQLSDSEAAWAVNLSLIAKPGAHSKDDYPQVAALLRRSIAPSQDESAARDLQAHLRMYQGQVDQEQRRIQHASIQSWSSVACLGDGLTLSELESALRAHGVALADGLSELEKASPYLKNWKL